MFAAVFSLFCINENSSYFSANRYLNNEASAANELFPELLSTLVWDVVPGDDEALTWGHVITNLISPSTIHHSDFSSAFLKANSEALDCRLEDAASVLAKRSWWVVEWRHWVRVLSRFEMESREIPGGIRVGLILESGLLPPLQMGNAVFPYNFNTREISNIND